MSSLCASTKKAIKGLTAATEKAASCDDVKACAASYRDDVFTAMATLRESVDGMEVLCDSELWPVPTYGDILFRV